MTEESKRETPTGQVAMLFSGGLDTTLEAVDRLQEYQAAHLLTFNNGCCINMGGARRRVEELRQTVGADRLVHVEIDTSPLLRSLREVCRRDHPLFHSPLVFDLVCKMSAVCELVRYARGRNIRDLCDGAAIEQTQVFLQHPEFGAHIKPWIESYGLRFLQPIHFGMGREDKIARLKELGVDAGTHVLEKVHITSQIRHQPFCLRGFVTFFFTSPLRHLGFIKRRSLPIDRAKQLWDLLHPIAERYVEKGELPA